MAEVYSLVKTEANCAFNALAFAESSERVRPLALIVGIPLYSRRWPFIYDQSLLLDISCRG